MPRRILSSIVLVLLITNVVTLIMLNSGKDDLGDVVLDEGEEVSFSLDDPVATIGEEEITYGDWTQSTRDVYGEKHLQTMIDHLIVEQLASKEAIEVDEKVIEREVSLLTTMEGVRTQAEIEQLELDWREEIIHRYQLEALLAQGVPITEEEAQSYFNSYQGQYNFDASVQSSHILVETMTQAEKIIAELQQGASFEMLAQEYSIDEETRKEGGYLGFLTKSSQFYPHEYVEAVSTMEEESYSEPLKIGDNIAIVYFHRELPAITFSYEEIKPYIKNEIALTKLEQTLTVKPLWEQVEIDWIFKAE